MRAGTTTGWNKLNNQKVYLNTYESYISTETLNESVDDQINNINIEKEEYEKTLNKFSKDGVDILNTFNPNKKYAFDLLKKYIKMMLLNSLLDKLGKNRKNTIDDFFKKLKENSKENKLNNLLNVDGNLWKRILKKLLKKRNDKKEEIIKDEERKAEEKKKEEEKN